MAVLSVSWVAVGVTMLLSPPQATVVRTGVVMLYAGAALLVPAVVACSGKLVPAAVFFLAAAHGAPPAPRGRGAGRDGG